VDHLNVGSRCNRIETSLNVEVGSPPADPGAGTKRTVFALIQEHDTAEREQQKAMDCEPF
jgi:hypothetical protein